MTQVAIQWRFSQLVAINTRDHGNIFLLPELIPVFHRPVANGTIHVGTRVLLVAEVNKVRERIDRFPREQVIVFLDLGELLNRGAIHLDRLMAGHAVRHSRDLHLAIGSRDFVASIAFESSLNVLPVTERDRLRDRLGGCGKILGLMVGAR